MAPSTSAPRSSRNPPASAADDVDALLHPESSGKGNGYGCTGTGIYREKGVYEQDVSMKKFWENDSIIWSEGIKQMDLVIKDDSGGGGHAHKRADWEKFFPTKMRITMVQVSAGSTYDPSLVPNLPRKTDAGGEKSKGGSASSSTSPAGNGKAGASARTTQVEGGCVACDQPEERRGRSVDREHALVLELIPASHKEVGSQGALGP